jgi:hypothetical protein
MKKIVQFYHFKKISYFFSSKIAICLSISLHEGRPIYRKAFIPQKRTSSTTELDISSVLLLAEPILTKKKEKIIRERGKGGSHYPCASPRK